MENFQSHPQPPSCNYDNIPHFSLQLAFKEETRQLGPSNMTTIPLSIDSISSLVNQHFGKGINFEELIPIHHSSNRRCFRPRKFITGSQRDSGSTITMDQEKYQVFLNVQQFAPDEITVKTVGRKVVVEAKHEEKLDEHGLISRQFVRRYLLPGEYEPEAAISSLSSDGVLSIFVPKKKKENEEEERLVPIIHTGPAQKGLPKIRACMIQKKKDGTITVQ